MPGRPPKANKLKVLQGSKNSKGAGNKKSPSQAASSYPRKPDGLDKFAEAEWNRLRNALLDDGRFHLEDRSIMIAYCQAVGLMRKAINALSKKEEPWDISTDGFPVQDPALSVFNRQLKNIESLALQLGLSPMGRERLGIVKETKKKSFAEQFQDVLNHKA